jgi:hypothetical protein
MAKRIEVILADVHYRGIQRAARSSQMSVAQWVQQELERACWREPSISTAKKLGALQVAIQHEFPTCDLEQILTEVESGYIDN